MNEIIWFEVFTLRDLSFLLALKNGLFLCVTARIFPTRFRGMLPRIRSTMLPATTLTIVVRWRRLLWRRLFGGFLWWRRFWWFFISRRRDFFRLLLFLRAVIVRHSKYQPTQTTSGEFIFTTFFTTRNIWRRIENVDGWGIREGTSLFARLFVWCW